ncbi:hypothetical protein FNV67_20110 [Streptomyces sp. S1D4-20]|nr:hypothetical protein FNV67_20110 [Streptomyces sp. S1D4-20]
MCVHIRFTSRFESRVFDADTRTITLPRILDHERSVTAVRAILAELAVPQPELGAVCWCGEPVDLLPRVPEQRRSEQVINHGA